MRTYLGLGRIGAVAALLGAAVPAVAQPCWSPADADAARIRELQSMLMVAALRCRADGIDILADYDALVTAERPAFAAANASLRGHFAAGGGAAGAAGEGTGEGAGEADYDHFATALANAYGDGGTREIGCNTAAGLMRDAAAAPDRAALLRLASAAVPPRELPGGACAKPEIAPVTLAPEVVAALETLARLQPQPVPATPTQLASTAP